MAGTMGLSNLLDDSELSSLSPALKDKLDNQINSYNTQIDELKSKCEKLRVNSEQQYCELERQLIESNTKLESESSSNIQLKSQLEELEKNYNEASSKLKTTVEAQEGNLSTQLRLTKVNEQLECEKREFAVLLEKRNREIDSLNDELKEMSRRLNETNTAKCESLVKLDDLQSSTVNKDFQMKRLEQEKANLQQQVDWLNRDLNERTKELMMVRREKSTKVLELQSSFDEKTEECALLTSTVESLRSTNADQSVKIEKLLQRIKDIQDSNTQAEEQFRQEIQARVKLVDIYRQSAEEEEVKSSQLTGAVTELQKLLKEAAQAHTELENEKNAEINRIVADKESTERRVESLEQELKNANELLSTLKKRGVSDEKLQAMFPTAAETSRILKSGMTLTEIYSEYVQASESLQLEKDENKRLNSYLDQILQEIEEKAPMLKKQREDYEIALKSIDQMTRQLDAAMVENQTMRSESDENHRKASHLTKENQRLQQQIRDLSDQVKFLVKEVEEVKGGRVVQDDTISSAEVNSSSRLISDKLVTFRDIGELQEQNQKLLAVIRELSDKQEQEESAAIDSRTRELKEQLEQAHEELNELKEARTRQADMVASIIQQRDCYRVLLREREERSSPIPVSAGNTSGAKSPGVSILKSPGAEKKTDEMSQALKQLQADFSTYKKEKMENDKIAQEQQDKIRQEASNLRIQNSKMASQLEFAGERYKVLQGNAEGYRKEIATLRDKIQKYTTSVAKHEQTINTLREDLMTNHEQLAQAQARVENLRSEKELIRSSEQRLSAELDSIRRERQTQTMLMANLQAIQNNLERNEFETKQRLGKQVETLEREKTFLKKRLETEDRQHQAAVKHWEKQVQESRHQVELEMKNHQQTKDLLTNTHKQLQDMKQQLVTATTKLSTAEARLSNKAAEGSEGSSEELRDLKSQVDQYKMEVDSLQAQLTKAKQHADQYKTIADSVQSTLKEQNMANIDFKEELEEKLRVANEARDHLTQRLDNLEKERQELLNENIRISEESHSLNADLRRQLTSLQNELQEVTERRETAISLETAAKQECEQQVARAAEAQDKYERELMLHAADVEALTALKREMEGFNSKLSESEERAKISERKLEEFKTSAESKQQMLVQEKEKLSARVNDLLNETRALHEQMGKLSSQVVSVQERSVATSRMKLVGSAADGKDELKSSEQLLEVVRYLRKEKDIAEGKLDVVETECSRLKQRCEVMEKQLEDANTQLSEERQQNQASMQTAAQHAELMHKVESNNLLQDSNKLLREEKTQLHTQLSQAEIKLSKLEEKIRPLQGEIRDLQAQKEALLIEKKTTTAEVERWKTRTNQLIENAHKTDPEEHKKLINEKEELRKQVNSTTEELHKTRAESTKSNLELAKLQRQMSNLTEENKKSSEECAKLKMDVEEKNKDSAEKVKTINQLKKIGRKYKEQAESITKDFEEYKNKHKGDAEQSQTVQQATIEQISALEKNVKEAETKVESLQKSLAEMEGKRDEAEKKATDSQSEKSQIEQKLTAAEIKLTELEKELETQKTERGQKEQSADTLTTQLRENVKELQQEIKQSKEENTKVKEEKAELEKKVTRCTTALQTSKNKLTSMKEINEKLTTERLEMKKKLSSLDQASVSSEEMELRVSSIKTMLETQIRRLEQDLANKEKENSDLQLKVQQLQKQLESSQKLGTPQPQVQVSRSTGSVAADRTSSSPSEPPRTANIRPIASSPAGIKPQTVPVQPQSAASKVTASIRPMAIAPTSSAQSTTPTATVMPTTVSQQELATEGEVITPVQQLFPQQSSSGTQRPTQQVQRVIPTQEVTSQEGSHDSSVEASVVEPQTSRDTPAATMHTSKRPREETESPGEDGSVKRSKILIAAAEQEVVEIPQITVTDESVVEPSTVTVDVAEVEASVPEETEQATEQVAPDVDEVEAAVEAIEEEHEVIDDEDDDSQVQADTDEGGSQGDDDDAVIIVATSDEDEQDDDYKGDDDEEEEEEEDEEEAEEVEDFSQEGMESYSVNDDDGTEEADIYEQDIEPEMEEVGYSQSVDDMQTQDEDQASPDDDDEIVIIDEEEDDMPAMESQEPESQASSQPSTQSSQLLPPLHPLPPERQLSVGRNQLPPFMLGSNPSGFEDYDDCTVPSTPTLSIPRRGDGFAEAVSSPQVSQRFVFGSGGEQQLSLSGLAQLDAQAALGMGMDDTRMDLTQLEEGSGRSVPSTPLHTSAPVTNIAEASEGLSSQSAETISFGQSYIETQSGEEEESAEAQIEEGGAVQEGTEQGDLEGEQGEEDSQEPLLEEDTDTQTEKETSKETAEQSTSKEDVVGSGASDKSQDASKPKIQKIVWNSPNPAPQPASTPLASGSQPIQSITSSQYRSGGRGGGPMQRSTPPSRVNRGGFQRGQARRPNRGRGNMYTRRPPMY